MVLDRQRKSVHAKDRDTLEERNGRERQKCDQTNSHSERYMYMERQRDRHIDGQVEQALNQSPLRS